MTRSPSDSEVFFSKKFYFWISLSRKWVMTIAQLQLLQSQMMLRPQKKLHKLAIGGGQPLKAVEKWRCWEVLRDHYCCCRWSMQQALGITLTEIDWLKTREVLGGVLGTPPVYKYDFSALNLQWALKKRIMLYEFDQTNQWSGGLSLELSITEPDCAKYLPEGWTSNALELNSLQACPDNPTPSCSKKIQPASQKYRSRPRYCVVCLQLKCCDDISHSECI